MVLLLVLLLLLLLPFLPLLDSRTMIPASSPPCHINSDQTANPYTTSTRALHHTMHGFILKDEPPLTPLTSPKISTIPLGSSPLVLCAAS